MKKWITNIKAFVARNKKLLALIVALNYTVKIGILLIIFLKAKDGKAQSTNSLIRTGNKNYSAQKYNQATENYTNALQKEPDNSVAVFNQAAAMYQLGEYEKAETYFDTLAKQSNNYELISKSLHNLGNAYYKKEDYEKSVAAYKQALKINPKDKDTKYNLMMAMNKLKKNQNSQSQQNQNNPQNQQDKNQQQNQDKNQQQQNQNNQQQQANKQQQQNMSKEEAERLLEALSNEEGKTQQKLDKQKGEPQKGKVRKDW
jgi:tetratricopeptide (TPR) repeat protein